VRLAKNEKTAPRVAGERNLSVESYVSISNLEHGKVYDQVFLIANVVHNSKMKTKQGKSFARVTLKDVTGELTGNIWGYQDELEEGGYAKLKIEPKTYRNAEEFSAQANQIEPVDVPLNQFDYVKGANDNILSAYALEIEDEITSIADPVYRDVMCNALHRLELMSALKGSPYGITGPMSYRGGLLVHVAHSMRLAKVAINQATELEIPFSPSLVVAGCALRNIGWHTTTLFQGDHLRSRDAHKMTGIYRASVRYIDHLMMTCENDLEIKISESKRHALENICNKQSDVLTLEGKIVACADNMADVLDFSVTPLQRKANGNWNDDLFTGHLS
jgi:hypothetical protein